MAVLVVVLTQAVLVLGVGLTEARAGCAHDGGDLGVGHDLGSAALPIFLVVLTQPVLMDVLVSMLVSDSH